MDFLNFFEELNGKGIKLTLENEALNLKSNAPVDAEILLQIKNNKQEIISFLKKYNTNLNLKQLLPKITPNDKEFKDKIPLSFSQERLWFIDQLQENSTEYHITTALRLQGKVRVDVLEKALHQIVTRHEVLRTMILPQNGIAFQEIVSADNWTLDKKKIVTQEELQLAIFNYFKNPFDLSKDYKLRTCLYELNNDEYILAFVFHHIASDGWSSGVFINEFTAIYHSLQKEELFFLPELELQYSDYAIWQRKYLEGSILDSQLSYWENKLKGVNNLVLPYDYPRPSIKSTEGARISFSLNESLTSAITKLCEEEGVTLFMFLLSAFKVLLSRYSGQEDICVGTPIANRTQAELEEMIGFFVNTLALRSDLSGNPSFRELLANVKETTLAAYDNQLAPFEKVVERVATSRDITMNPLFEVMFSLQNTPEMTDGKYIDLEGIMVSEYNSDLTSTHFDLTLNANVNNSEIIFDIVYCTVLFKKETIERLQYHLQALLNSIIKNIQQPIYNLEFLSEEEKHQQLTVFNDTTVAYPQDQTIVELFAEQVAKTPNAVAIVFEDEQLTYQELDIRSNQLAHYLMSKNKISSEDLIGVILERNEWLIISYLAVLKLGAAYVPIDPNYPQERIEFIKNDSCGNKIIDQQVLNDFEANRHNFSQDLYVKIDKNTLAYVIYTSGSTGKPKGVMVEHKNLVNLCFWHQKEYNVSSNSKSTLFSGIGFDAGVWEIYPYLISGACLYPISEYIRYDFEKLSNFLVTEKITHTYIPTSMLYSIINQKIDLSNIIILTGGDALHLNKKPNNLKIYNNYGPTETTIVAANYKVPHKPVRNIPIGKPIKNTNIYILSTSLELLPLGIVGEIVIGGAQVTRGYLNLPELTKEKFVTNPFKEGERMYRTGDLGRWLPDGNIEFIGRKDDQVKIRGYRIELGEIESVLLSVKGVQQCCVLAKEDANGLKRLIGYVTVEGDFDKEYLQTQLKQSLPDYMVPMIWVQMEKMPLTSNGKLDKRALPDPDTSSLSTKQYVAPRNEIEEQLVVIWQELLGVEQIGIYDNFFELGGHSLLVVQMISSLQKLEFNISIKEIFVNPTIAYISDKLTDLSNAYIVPANGIISTIDCITPSMVPLVDLSQNDLEKIVSVIPGGVSNIQDIYPLSPLQEGIHFHHLISNPTEGDPYVLPNLLSFSSKEKRDSFVEALQFVVNRHDILRTCVLNQDLPLPVQVVLREATLEVTNLDIDSTQDVLLQVQQLVDTSSKWIDLSKAPLLTLKSVDDSINDSYFLIICQHHIILDHVGLEKIISEIFSYLSGDTSNLPTPVLYREFIGHTLYTQSVNDGETYFKSLLQSIEEPTYPFGLSNILNNGSKINEASIVLEEELSGTIRKICTQLGISPAILFHAAFGVVIAKTCNKEYAVFGSLFSGRLQGASGASVSLGLFINTIPVILRLEGNVSEYINHVRRQLQDLLQYEQTPLADIQNWSNIPNNSSLFSALFNYRHTNNATLVTDTKEYGFEILSSHERTNYPLSFSVDDFGTDFSLSVQIVSNDVLANRVLQYMIQVLEGFTEELISDTQRDVKILNIVTEEEKNQQLTLFNDTAVASPQDKTIVELFAEQVAKTPNAVAIVFEDEQLTYQELDNRSNQLAHYLISQGVVSETLIGICVERSAQMMVGILGILKSGGAYVPIDPEYPATRIEYMVEDTKMNFILSNIANSANIKSTRNLQIILLDNDWKSIATYPDCKPACIIVPNHLAYIIYTSGSTGAPKGVMVTHQNVVSLSINSDYIVLNKDTVWMSTGSISFDATTIEFWGTLLNGGKLILASTQTLLETSKLKQLILNHKATVLWMSTTWFHQVVDDDLTLFSNLEYFLVGGDIIFPRCINKLIETYPNLRVINCYGPTENTTYSTVCKIDKTIEKNIPIGKPLHNRQAYILDNSLQLLPVGVVGELCVAGDGLALGYLNQPELTAEKFVPNPFKEGERIYKTGDLARWLPDGNIEFVGRKDNQVKIRGYRVELGEIENTLTTIAGVNHCCVLAKEDANGVKRLIGYVTVEGDFDKEYLQTQLKQSLPDYMVPMIWIQMETMPLTSNGKLDKRALPNPDNSFLSTKQYVAPRNEIEEQLALIWQELLGVEQIGVYDNFFELGGHSLLATRLVSMIRKEFSVELTIREIFECTTIDEQQTIIEFFTSDEEIQTNKSNYTEIISI